VNSQKKNYNVRIVHGDTRGGWLCVYLSFEHAINDNACVVADAAEMLQ
jgi:hypothetical protein